MTETPFPTSAIVAADRLASLCYKWRTTADYYVVHTHHEAVPTLRWQNLAVQLLIGELCHPAVARTGQLAHIRASAFRQEPPPLMLGPPTPLAPRDSLEGHTD